MDVHRTAVRLHIGLENLDDLIAHYKAHPSHLIRPIDT